MSPPGPPAVQCSNMMTWKGEVVLSVCARLAALAESAIVIKVLLPAAMTCLLAGLLDGKRLVFQEQGGLWAPGGADPGAPGWSCQGLGALFQGEGEPPDVFP